MAFFKVTSKIPVDYDETIAFVVRARSEQQAKHLVQDKFKPEPDGFIVDKRDNFRFNDDNIRIERMSSTGAAEIVLTSYLHG